MIRATNILLPMLILASTTVAQMRLVPARTDSPPVLDGYLDDRLWQMAQRYDGFETFQPDFGKQASEYTVVQIGYDDDFLYFSFEARDSEPDKIKASVAKWDNMFQDDWVGVGIDALNDQQSAYTFTANALGSQGDLMLDSEGNGDASEDFIWHAAGAMNDSGFCVEMRVPLQSIRYAAGRDVEMSLFFARQLSRYSEMAAFPPIYPDKGALLTQLGIVIFKDLRYHRTYEVLPSFTQSENREAEDGELRRIREESGSDIGVTAKMSITPTLTLDLTLNPDFSQIETDASQVDVNLRSPNYYPEKRPFFLEGIKNFDVAGISESSAISQVVHTRTIADPSLGLKLTGKLGRSNALAAILARNLSPQYEEDGDQPADFGIVRYKRLLRDESYIGGIITAREHQNGYNRVAGVDALWRLSGTMALEGNALYGLTEYPEEDSVSKTHNVDLSWTLAIVSIISISVSMISALISAWKRVISREMAPLPWICLPNEPSTWKRGSCRK